MMILSLRMKKSRNLHSKRRRSQRTSLTSLAATNKNPRNFCVLSARESSLRLKPLVGT